MNSTEIEVYSQYIVDSGPVIKSWNRDDRKTTPLKKDIPVTGHVMPHKLSYTQELGDLLSSWVGINTVQKSIKGTRNPTF